MSEPSNALPRLRKDEFWPRSLRRPPNALGSTHYSPRRTEGRRRYLYGFQDRGKQRAGLWPKKSLCRSRAIRTRAQEVVHRREACPLPGVVEFSEPMVAKREVPVSPFHAGAGALEYLTKRCGLVLEPVLLHRMQRMQRPAGLKQWCPAALGKHTKRFTLQHSVPPKHLCARIDHGLSDTQWWGRERSPRATRGADIGGACGDTWRASGPDTPPPAAARPTRRARAAGP